MTRTTSRIGLGAFLLASLVATAHAGLTYGVVVSVTPTAAQGSMAAARSAPDNITYLECSETAMVGSNYVACYAREAGGKSAACATNDPNMVAQVRALQGDSSLYFAWDSSGHCSQISVTQGSMFGPKSP